MTGIILTLGAIFFIPSLAKAQTQPLFFGELIPIAIAAEEKGHIADVLKNSVNLPEKTLDSDGFIWNEEYLKNVASKSDDALKDFMDKNLNRVFIRIKEDLIQGKNYVELIDNSGTIINKSEADLLDIKSITKTIENVLVENLGLGEMSVATYLSSIKSKVKDQVENIAKDLDEKRYVAFMTLNDTVLIYLTSKLRGEESFSNSKNFSRPAALKYASIEFHKGFIRQIKVGVEAEHKLNVNGNYKTVKKMYTFSNNYSFGISSVRNLKDLSRAQLISQFNKIDTASFYNNRYNKYDYDGSKVFNSYSLLVGDLIDHIEPLVYANQLDLSPTDGVYQFSKDGLVKPLRDTKRKNLLNYHVFTDLSGLVSGSGNGLVQLDLNKNVNLMTTRKRWFPRLNTGFGFINNFNVYGKLQKIEKNLNAAPVDINFADENLQKLVRNNELHSQALIDSTFSNESTRDISTVTLEQFTNKKIGVDLDVFTIENQHLKSEIYLRFKSYFGQVNILPNVGLDSLNSIDNKSVTSINSDYYAVGFSIAYRLYSKEFFNVYAEHSWLWNRLLMNSNTHDFNLQLSEDPNSFTNSKKHNFLGVMSLSAVAKLGKTRDSEIIFRYGLYSSRNRKNNLARYELGFRKTLKFISEATHFSDIVKDQL